jgi:fluoride exporter
MGAYLAVALGGAAGSMSRFGIDQAIERRSFAVFPWATFTINISGCLLIGVAVAALVDRHPTPAWLRTGLVVGFLGGYTTFSTFAQEGLDLMREGQSAVAVLYGWGACSSGSWPSTRGWPSAACCG